MRELPQQRMLTIDGAELCVFEWQGRKRDSQQVLLVHATGFHARCWDQVVAHLPADWTVFAVDMRGHGRSANQGPFTWQRFGDDLLQVCAQLKLVDAIAVGHSMGGHCLTHTCGHNAHYFRHMVLVDPVIMDLTYIEHRRGINTTVLLIIQWRVVAITSPMLKRCTTVTQSVRLIRCGIRSCLRTTATTVWCRPLMAMAWCWRARRRLRPLYTWVISMRICTR